MSAAGAGAGAAVVVAGTDETPCNCSCFPLCPATTEGAIQDSKNNSKIKFFFAVVGDPLPLFTYC
jgi:hypothetical protein